MKEIKEYTNGNITSSVQWLGRLNSVKILSDVQNLLFCSLCPFLTDVPHHCFHRLFHVVGLSRLIFPIDLPFSAPMHTI